MSAPILHRPTAIAWVLVALWAGCRSPSAAPDGSAIAGPIAALNFPDAASRERPTVHVKTDSTDPCGIVFQIAPSTVIVRRVGTRVESATATELSLGQKVRVWAASMILESCPARSTAARIEMVP